MKIPAPILLVAADRAEIMTGTAERFFFREE